MSDSIARCIELLFMLSEHRFTRDDIAAELDVDKRTVNRDLNRLRNAGVKISKLAGGTFRVEKDWWMDQFKIRRRW